MSAIRTFIALPTSEENQKAMTEIQTALRATESDVKWDTPNKFHITVKFLGNTSTDTIDELSKSLHEAAQNFSSLQIHYTTLGAFPSAQNPRVVWIGIENNDNLLQLQRTIENTCFGIGFQKEERPFHPHITLGRVKGNRNIARLTEAIKTITFDTIISHCAEIILMKSDLYRSGSIYTKLKSFSLQP